MTPPSRKRRPAPKAARTPSVRRKRAPGVTPPKDITIAGTFDDGKLSPESTRRFLWWKVAHEHGAPVTILSPWWERTLYAIARIWS